MGVEVASLGPCAKTLSLLTGWSSCRCIFRNTDTPDSPHRQNTLAGPHGAPRMKPGGCRRATLGLGPLHVAAGHSPPTPVPLPKFPVGLIEFVVLELALPCDSLYLGFEGCCGDMHIPFLLWRFGHARAPLQTGHRARGRASLHEQGPAAKPGWGGVGVGPAL